MGPVLFHVRPGWAPGPAAGDRPQRASEVARQGAEGMLSGGAGRAYNYCLIPLAHETDNHEDYG
jgi:hypothetical protein